MKTAAVALMFMLGIELEAQSTLASRPLTIPGANVGTEEEAKSLAFQSYHNQLAARSRAADPTEIAREISIIYPGSDLVRFSGKEMPLWEVKIGKSDRLETVAVAWVNPRSRQVRFLFAPWGADRLIVGSETEQILGEPARNLAGARIIVPSNNLLFRIRASQITPRATSIPESAPESLEQAGNFISRSVNMAGGGVPRVCFERDDTYYFSGGTAAFPIDDFSSGMFIRKGEKTVYTWTSLAVIESVTPAQK